MKATQITFPYGTPETCCLKRQSFHKISNLYIQTTESIQ